MRNFTVAHRQNAGLLSKLKPIAQRISRIDDTNMVGVAAKQATISRFELGSHEPAPVAVPAVTHWQQYGKII